MQGEPGAGVVLAVVAEALGVKLEVELVLPLPPAPPAFLHALGICSGRL